MQINWNNSTRCFGLTKVWGESVGEFWRGREK